RASTPPPPRSCCSGRSGAPSAGHSRSPPQGPAPPRGRAAAGGRPCAGQSAGRRPGGPAAPPGAARARPPTVRSPGRSKRQLESGRQPEPRRHAAHLLGDGGLDAVRGIVERRGDEVLEHLAVVAEQRGIDGNPLHLVLARHLHLHHAGAGLSLDFDGGELLLHAAHVVLHHLRLLHELPEVRFHFCLSLSVSCTVSRMVDSTILPSKRLTSSFTKPSFGPAWSASARRASRSLASSAAAVTPPASPTATASVTRVPRWASSAALSFS